MKFKNICQHINERLHEFVNCFRTKVNTILDLEHKDILGAFINGVLRDHQ
jgi:hypothetical protein